MKDDLVSPLRAVCVLDPALDRAAMGESFERYVLERDPDLVRALPGQHPRWAILRPLDPGEAATAEAQPGFTLGGQVSYACALAAFRLSCVRVENATAPGVALLPTGPSRRVDGQEAAVWSDEDLRTLTRELGGDFVHELGQLAYQRARAGKWWSGGVGYTLPRSSTHGLEQIARLLAARERASASTGSSERSAGASQNATPPSSDAGTAAAATAGTAAAGG